MSNARIMLDFIKEKCPDKISKDWVIWALNYVIQMDASREKISPSYLRLPGQHMFYDPVFDSYSKDAEPEMK